MPCIPPNTRLRDTLKVPAKTVALIALAVSVADVINNIDDTPPVIEPQSTYSQKTPLICRSEDKPCRPLVWQDIGLGSIFMLRSTHSFYRFNSGNTEHPFEKIPYMRSAFEVAGCGNNKRGLQSFPVHYPRQNITREETVLCP